MKHKVQLFLFLSLVMGMMSSCEKNQTNADNPIKIISLTECEQTKSMQGNEFALRFLNQIEQEKSIAGSYLLSPLSLQLTLSMLLEGADGTTLSQIAQVLGYGIEEIDALRSYSEKLLRELPKLDNCVQFALAQALIHSHPILDSYKADVSRYYEAELYPLNAGKGDLVKQINRWCSEKTGGQIKQLFSQDELHSTVAAILLQALSFKGAWQFPFDKKMTTRESFFPENGAQKEVDMMKIEKQFHRFRGASYSGISIPFGNTAFSMQILLPDRGVEIKEITRQIAGGGLEKPGQHTCSTSLWIPRYETQTTIKLNDLLKKMGIKDAFDSGCANFSKMSGEKIFLDIVKQSTAIKVNEDGAESSAATGAVLTYTGTTPINDKDMHLDRTFLYLIRENSTGAILFFGKYDGD